MSSITANWTQLRRIWINQILQGLQIDMSDIRIEGNISNDDVIIDIVNNLPEE